MNGVSYYHINSKGEQAFFPRSVRVSIHPYYAQDVSPLRYALRGWRVAYELFATRL